MSPHLDRFTARGGPEVEARIRGAVSEAADVMRAVLRPEEYRAVVLLGGYGRGEGGVELRDGEERPHNNLDFLVIGAVSDRALIGRGPLVGSFAHRGTRPQRAVASSRTPVSPCRTIGSVSPGATLYWGSQSNSPSTANCSRKAAPGWVRKTRPHMQ